MNGPCLPNPTRLHQTSEEAAMERATDPSPQKLKKTSMFQTTEEERLTVEGIHNNNNCLNYLLF